MYCNNCGAELRDGVAFCEQCGKAINEENRKKNKLEVKKNRKPLIISIITAVLLLTIGIVAIVNTGILNPVQHNLSLGYKYLEEGNYEEALIAFNKVLEIEPNNTKAIIGSADAHVGLGEFDVAVSILTTHIEIDNTKTELYDKLIELYLSEEDFYSAQTVIDNALEAGYNYNINDLSKEIQNRLQQAQNNSSGFKTGMNAVETNSKVVTIDANGVKVRNVDSNDEKIITRSKFDETFATDGETAYLYDSKDQTIKMLSFNSGKITNLSKAYITVPFDGDNGDIYEYGTILGVCNGFLYFQEEYGAGSGTDYILDINAKKYSKMNTSANYIGSFKTYKDKIYYDEARQDVRAVTVYEAKADGSNEKPLIKNAINFDIVGNKLYYTQIEDEYYDMDTVVKYKSYNLDTKQTENIAEIKGGGWSYFTSFGFAYGQTTMDDPYGIHINNFNGGTIRKNGDIVCSGENYVLCREAPVSGSIPSVYSYYVVENGISSKTFLLSTQEYILGYFGKKVYYYEYSPEGIELKTLDVEFE